VDRRGSREIASFVDQGLPVFGPLPKRSPSLANYPTCDEEVRRLSAKLAARVANGADLAPVLKLPPDVSGIDGRKVVFTHRRTADADIYFLSNQTEEPQAITAAFRVSGRVPEFWHPDTGRIEPALSEKGEGVTRVPLTLDPTGSVFVVFRDKPSAAAVGRMAGNAPVQWAALAEVNGPWSLEFPAKSVTIQKLESWSVNADPAIKYFSGTATYRTTFKAKETKSPVMLDLGEVGALAEVTLNGKTFPALWKAPYRLEVTDALKSGSNELQVRVVNQWRNRMIGQQREPAALGEPEPWMSLKMEIDPKKRLLPAGLLGPVQLLTPQASGQ
jgi:hypothetical protein